MQDQSWKVFTGASFLLLICAVVPRAWSQDPATSVSSEADTRDRAVAACMAEAKARGAKLGAVDVEMRQVEDTDKKSDGRASVRALVDVVLRKKDGSTKTEKKTFKCDTRNGVITAFKYY
ncbi:hypothetical protein [Novosphingobium sp. ZW T3_23]|uniref:hypothetical protein n=1 Tax=Novosphingobium sp. ZW T3_23 TaxID=3378084 RepID=UPI003853EFA9